MKRKERRTKRKEIENEEKGTENDDKIPVVVQLLDDPELPKCGVVESSEN